MMRPALVFGAACLAGAAAANGAPPATSEGAKVYQRCAACHLANGKGVPGSFPALAGRLGPAAVSEAGRAYLVMTVAAGAAGEIDVDGTKIRGFMPAQAGLSDADIAAVLNYVLTFDGAKAPTAFTAEEVAKVKATVGKADPNAVHAMRAAAFAAPEPPQ